MQYNKCIVSKPGLLDNVSLDFDDKVTIISGKNGAGKSFLAKCMIDGIWKRFCKSSLLPKKMWNSIFVDLKFHLNEDVQYQFTNNSDKYLTIRSINGSSNRVVYSDDANDNSTDVIELNEISDDTVLKDFFENIDLNTFASTSFMAAPTDIENTRAINYFEIKKILLDDNTGYYYTHNLLKNTFKNSEQTIDPITKKFSEYENKLKEIEKNINLIDIQNTRISKLVKERKTVCNEIDNLSSSLKRLNNRIEVLGKIYNSLRKLEELRESFSSINSEFEDEKEKRKSIFEIKKELNSLFPQFKNLKDFDNRSLDKLQGIYREIRNLNEKIDNFFYDRKKTKDRLKKLALTLNLSAASLIFSIFYKNDFSIKNDLIILAGIFGFSLIFSLILILYSIISTKTEKIISFNDEKNELEEKLKIILEESNVELEGYKLSELYEFLLQYFEEYIEYSERSSDLKKLENSLKDKIQVNKIKEELNLLKKLNLETKKEIDYCIKSLEDCDGIELEAQRIKELILISESDLRNVNKQIDIKKNVLKQIDIEIDQTPFDNDEKKELFKNKKSIETILKKLISNKNSINFVIELMEKSIFKNEENQLLMLVNSVYEKFNFLTENQYITIVDKNLIKRIIVDNDANQELNATIIHLLYLSIKISLTQFLKDNNISLPLIIDDPFLFMDDDRTERFKELIFDISNNRQIIIFTHLRNKKDWGSYIELK